jgi:hypothetical protein
MKTTVKIFKAKCKTALSVRLSLRDRQKRLIRWEMPRLARPETQFGPEACETGCNYLETMQGGSDVARSMPTSPTTSVRLLHAYVLTLGV